MAAWDQGCTGQVASVCGRNFYCSSLFHWFFPTINSSFLVFPCFNLSVLDKKLFPEKSPYNCVALSRRSAQDAGSALSAVPLRMWRQHLLLPFEEKPKCPASLTLRRVQKRETPSESKAKGREGHVTAKKAKWPFVRRCLRSVMVQ